MPDRTMERNTLKYILTDAGLPAATITQVIEALERHAGPYKPTSRAALIRTEARRWEWHKMVRSRVVEHDGEPEFFTVYNIKL